MEINSVERSFYSQDRDYVKWLKKWGQCNFNMMKYLPQILTNKQINAAINIQKLYEGRRLRNKQIQLGYSIDEINKMYPMYT